MNEFSENFVIKKVIAEYATKKYIYEKDIPAKLFSFGIENEDSKTSMIIAILNPVPSGGIIGFAVYFAEKNKLMVYDFDGNLISFHENMTFVSVKKKRKKIGII